MDKVEVSTFIEASPEELYDAWMSSKGHSDMTGAEAITKAELGAKFTAGGGYISGKNITLKKPGLIIQSWRTTEFSNKDDDSFVEVTFKKEKDGTKIQSVHTNIPKGQGRMYRKWWIESYFPPMEEYFNK
jgi:activator of HSP90 ATPase